MNKLSMFFDHICVAAKQSGKSVEQVLALAKQWGIEQVEINCLDPMITDDTKAMLDRLKIGVSCVCADMDFTHDDAQSSAKKYSHAFDTAQLYGCRKVLCIPGFYDEGGDTLAQFDAVCERLNEMCAEGKRRGITVAIEDFDHRLSPCCTSEQMLSLTDRVDGLKIAFDLGNFAYGKEDIATAYDLLKGDIVHVHCKDRGFTTVTDTVAHDKEGGTMYSLPVGSGELKLDYWIKRIIADGYRGSLVLEHFGLSNQLDAIALSVGFVKGLEINIKG